MKEKIKIGVLIKSHELLLWEYKILERLINSEFAEIKLLIEKEESPVRLSRKDNSVVFRFHERLDKYVFRNQFDFDKKINIIDFIGDVPLILYDQANDNSTNHIINEISEKTKNYNLDIILNFGCASLNKALLKIPRYGIWSYKIGDHRIIRGIPPVYWEIVKRLPEIGCIVQKTQSDYNNESVIYRTTISTFTRSISINKNRAYGLASLIVPRLIKGLFDFGSSYLDKSISKFNSDTEIFSSRLYKSPTSLKALWNLILIFTINLYRNIVYIKKDYWYLLFKINENKKSFPATIDTFELLTAPKGKFWADPFVVTKNGYHYIFVEEYLFKTKKAHISVLKLDERGSLLSNDRIIEQPYHMSYPFIFELHNKYYMIPESREDRTIQLYTCTSFPDRWEFVMNLMDNVSATDSTLFFYNDKWWLFTAVDELNNPSVPFRELFLYYSEDLFSGHWKGHPMNPIIADVKTSRPAGKIFILNNKIYRPSQDCSGDYGKAFNFSQISKLNENEYEEILVSKVEPDWNSGLIGTHTFNFNDNITVIDASPVRKRIRFSQFKNHQSG